MPPTLAANAALICFVLCEVHKDWSIVFVVLAGKTEKIVSDLFIRKRSGEIMFWHPKRVFGRSGLASLYNATCVILSRAL